MKVTFVTVYVTSSIFRIPVFYAKMRMLIRQNLSSAVTFSQISGYK